MLIRSFTLEESTALIFLAADLGRIDPELGRLTAQLAGGHDEVLPAIHDRLTVCGRPEQADRLRRIIGVE